LLEPRSFNEYKNAVVPMIAMLDYLEVNIEISDVDIETMESDGCREISEADRNTNGILTMI